MSVNLPINDSFPSPEEIEEKQRKNIKVYWTDNQEALPLVKEWIKMKYKACHDKNDIEDKRYWSKTGRLLLGAESMELELMYLRKSHEAKVNVLEELKELKKVVNRHFEILTEQYPSEAMHIKGLFGTAKTDIKPKYFKEL